MATISERLAYVLTFDTSSGVKSLQKMGATADKELGKVDKRLDKLGVGMQKFGAGSVAAAGVIGVGLFKMAQGAADADANMSALEQVVGELVAQDIGEWAEGSAQAVGLASKEAVAASTQFAGLGKIIGLSGGQLAEFATQHVELAADMAAFKNVAPQQAIEDISAAYAGSTEVLRKYNIFLDERTLKEAYARETGERVTGTLSTQQKIIAVNAELYRQSADMAGQFGRESGELAGQQAILKAELTNLSDEIGAGVLPHLVNLMSVVGSAVGVFTSLDSATNGMAGTMAVAGTALLAAGGAASFIIGKLIVMRQQFLLLKSVMIGHPIMLFATVAATLGAAFLTLRNRTDDTKDAIDDMAEAMYNAETAAEGLANRISEAVGETDILLRTFDVAGVTVDEVAAAALEGGQAWTDMAMRLAKASREIESTGQEQERLRLFIEEYTNSVDGAVAQVEALERVHGEAAVAVEDAAGSVDEMSTSTEKLAGMTQAARESVDELRESMIRAVDDTYSLDKAELSLADAVDKIHESYGEAIAISEDSEATDREKEASLRAVESAQIAAAEEALAASVAYAKEKTGQEGTVAAASAQIEYLNRLKEQYPELVGQIDGYILTLGEVPGVVNTTVTADISGASASLDTLIGRLNAIGARVTTASAVSANRFRQTSGPVNSPTVAPVGFRAKGGPVRAGEAYIVGEDGPELLRMGGQSGSVIPNDKLGTGGTVVNHITINTGADPKAVVDAIRTYNRHHGKGWWG